MSTEYITIVIVECSTSFRMRIISTSPLCGYKGNFQVIGPRDKMILTRLNITHNRGRALTIWVANLQGSGAGAGILLHIFDTNISLFIIIFFFSNYSKIFLLLVRQNNEITELFYQLIASLSCIFSAEYVSFDLLKKWKEKYQKRFLGVKFYLLFFF